MSLRLLLLRHAKSSRDVIAADRDRPLTDKGREAAAVMGARMREAGLVPRSILCSPALRTRQTLLEALPALLPVMPEAAEILLRPAFYGADGGGYLAAIAEHGGSDSPLLVVGHNPAIHDCARLLVAGPAGALEAGFPTAALAVIEVEVEDWSELVPRRGTLVSLLLPQETQ